MDFSQQCVRGSEGTFVGRRVERRRFHCPCSWKFLLCCPALFVNYTARASSVQCKTHCAWLLADCSYLCLSLYQAVPFELAFLFPFVLSTPCRQLIVPT